jgi:hypothetical protein
MMGILCFWSLVTCGNGRLKNTGRQVPSPVEDMSFDGKIIDT